MVTREVHRSSLRRLICPGPFHFSYGVDICILLSILVCAAASLFCACLVSVQVSAPYLIAGSTQELYTMSLQADGKVAFEDVPVFAAMIIRCISLSWFFSLRL